MDYRQALRAALSCLTLGLVAGLAQAQVQQRPDSGTVLERPSQLPALPRPGGPELSVPAITHTAPANGALAMLPSGFRFDGNTVFPSELLAALLSPRVGKPTDLNGLSAAAQSIRDYYRERGYLLTDAYIPAQQFSAQGGTVTIAVVEARIGRATVSIEGDNQPDSVRMTAEAVVAANLKSGDLITAYALEKPVLLLRDLAGYDATATVQPGSKTGEADVLLTVKASSLKLEMSLGLDNYGVRSSGSLRAFANASLANPLGRGDLLSARVQLTDVSGSNLYRLNYSLPVGGLGTRLSLDATRTAYALGKEFAALGASGTANIIGLSAIQPLRRSREHNLFILAAIEQKKLSDQTTTPASQSSKTINDARVSVLGNFADDWFQASAFNSYSLGAASGQLRLDAASLAADQAATGLNTAGRFSKLNGEYQRVQYFGRSSQVQFSLQSQAASRNLSSAEKMVLGGPTGVRGYAVGDGAGDTGALFNLEYRYLLPPPVLLAGEPVSLSAFYDWGTVRVNQNGSPVPADANITLSAAGLGAVAGRSGNYLLSAWLAWPLNGALRSSADPSNGPRLWLSVQKWL